MKKLISLLSAAAILVGALAVAPADGNMNLTADAASSYNYAEALQKSMFFYEVQQSGPLADWNEVSWRADCMLDDYVPGGWFDAGDHIKFALTNAYSSTLLAWGLLEYPEGPENTGLIDLYRNNLQFSLDFLVGCDLGDEVVYQIGDIGFDHVWWGSAEVYMNKLALKGVTEREYYTTTDSNIAGHMAAALASGYLVFKDVNPTLAAEYLAHAKNCFKIADTSRTHGNTPASDAMYKSSHFYDELFWAANWLYMATGEQSYLDLCESDYIPNLGKEDQSTEMKYTWGFCWDDTQQGGTLLYAINTGNATWKEQFRKHLEYWTTGYGGKQITYTPDGLAWLTNWGSLRHATTTAFLAYVACDELFADDKTASDKYTAFADSQMNYCLGDNDNDLSYVIGMGSAYPKAWHHRTSSGVWDDQWTTLGETKEYAHVLYGALVGGPGSSGAYNDKVSSYENSEVAIDYNAGYTAALCAMTSEYGGTKLADFPVEETPKWNEFYIEACINQASSNFTEVKVLATNHSAWPTRVIPDLSYNYYMDLTELFDAGYTASDLQLRVGYDEFNNVSISGPFQYSDNIYYVKLTYADGTKVMPTGQSEHQGEVQFRVSAPDGTNFWDATNDYSFNGLVSQTVAETSYITMYDGDTLIWGTEPDGTTPKIPDEPDDPDEPTVLYGDVNCDGNVDIRDVAMLAKAATGLVTLSEQGRINADIKADGNINVLDVSLLAKYNAGVVQTIPQ